ncbi:MAG: histidine kinase N-terminal 7TM domain-containing protein [Myxococcota bacterium]
MEPYALLLEAMILLGLWLCLSLWQQNRSTPGRWTFAFATVAWMAWCLGELATLRQWLPECSANLVLQIGALALPPLWLGVAAQTARLEIARRVPWFPIPLLAPAVCVAALMSTARWRGLYLTTAANSADVPGPLFDVMLVYDFALALLGCGVLLLAALRWPEPGDWPRRIAVGVAPLIPLAGCAVYLDRFWPGNLDPTPVLLGITLLLLYRSVFAGGLLQPLSMSQHALIQQLPLGVVLTDRRGVIVDVNPVAERQLGLVSSAAVGRNFDAVIHATGSDFGFEFKTVVSGGSEAGQIVIFDPPAKPGPAVVDLEPSEPDFGEEGLEI